MENTSPSGDARRELQEMLALIASEHIHRAITTLESVSDRTVSRQFCGLVYDLGNIKRALDSMFGTWGGNDEEE